MDTFRRVPRAARPAPIDITSDRLKEDIANSPNQMSAAPSPASTRSASSDYSPLTSSFSSATTPQLSVSNSSITSSPCAFDQVDVFPTTPFPKRSAPALPDVLEHPLELEDPDADVRMSIERVESPQPIAISQRLEAFPYSDMPDSNTDKSGLGDFQESTWDKSIDQMDLRSELSPKRRRANVEGITSRFFERLPSLVKHKGRRGPLGFHSDPNSTVTSPIAGRSRSNSRARTSLSLFRKSDAMDTDNEEPNDADVSERFETINEDEDVDGQEKGDHSHLDQSWQRGAQPEDLERVHTPLLPMLIDDKSVPASDAEAAETGDIVDSVISDGGHDSMCSIQHTPQLSAKVSTNFAQSSLPKAVVEDDQGSSGVEASILSIAEDEWSCQLGHANFFIRPKPYLPREVSADSCTALLLDWEKARSEYSKHLARTNQHFGQGSRTYRLTEEKWASIDAEWRRNYDGVRATGAVRGVVPPNSPTEPAPVVKIPSLDDKFPQLADFEVVGAMERVDPPQRASTQIKRDSSVKTGFKKLIDGFNRRSRSASGPR